MLKGPLPSAYTVVKGNACCQTSFALASRTDLLVQKDSSWELLSQSVLVLKRKQACMGTLVGKHSPVLMGS